jgi:CRISPR-associated exonuclease Cas4
MLGVPVGSGDLFYGETRRRQEVLLDHDLRDVTVCAISRVRILLSGTTLPSAHFRKECEACSLLPGCLPKAPAGARAYVAAEIAQLAEVRDL